MPAFPVFGVAAGAGEQVALGVCDAEAGDHVELTSGLDAFGDHQGVEGVREGKGCCAELGRDGLPQRVTIELTEHAHVTSYSAINSALSDLRQQGLRLSIDDTGAGYASFSHVLELKPDSIKLDRSWLAEIEHDSARRATGPEQRLYGRSQSDNGTRLPAARVLDRHFPGKVKADDSIACFEKRVIWLIRRVESLPPVGRAAGPHCYTDHPSRR